MKRPHSRAFAYVLAFAFLSGCSGKPTAHEHEHGHEAEGLVTFKEGVGLLLPQETSIALGVKTADVVERSIAPEFEVTASVFDAGPPARASALVPAEVAAELAKNPPATARLIAVRHPASSSRAQAEIVLEVSGAPRVGATVHLALRGSAREGAAVPHSAVLRSATGTFVYVVNGAYLLRTPLQTGASDGEYIEILDGLYTGDVVVTAAVEQLWLTELRLTKGGGHSH